jgi:ADP-ribose pyrophosphatase YjhB (NUDIX family)
MSIVLYHRPGGFVNVGETVENAVLREVHEETNVMLDEDSVFQVRTVSDPRRDPRRHTVSVVFRCDHLCMACTARCCETATAAAGDE